MIHKIIKLFVNELTLNVRHYLLNRDNLWQEIKMKLCQKQKNFSEFFFCIFKIYIKFHIFDKKRWPSQLMYFQKYQLRKISLDKCLKTVFQRTFRQTTSQMDRNTVALWMAEPLQYLLITVKVVALEKVSFSDTQNPKSVC